MGLGLGMRNCRGEGKGGWLCVGEGRSGKRRFATLSVDVVAAFQVALHARQVASVVYTHQSSFADKTGGSHHPKQGSSNHLLRPFLTSRLSGSQRSCRLSTV